ncbi:MAG: hypothetical protein PHU93_04670 [Candidatus Gracilibacteria bacterium]|nr:hypothetical protein [Candidatus Gracilibacteria bacterium]
MDIKSLSKKLSVFGAKAAVVSTSMFEKAGKFTGDMLEKTADLTFDKIKTTQFCIQNAEAFDEVKGHKNLVFFVVSDRENTQSKAIVGRMPLNVGKAWQYSATLKIIYALDLPELVQALDVVAPCACIYKNGEMKYQLTGPKLDMFLENFDIFCDWDEVVIAPVTSTSTPPINDTTTPVVETPPVVTPPSAQ